MKNHIRLATVSDIPDILPVLDAARGIMRASGNMHQWADGYPSADAIMKDIDRSSGYVIVENPDRAPAAEYGGHDSGGVIGTVVAENPDSLGSDVSALAGNPVSGTGATGVERIVAYFAFLPSPEPTYSKIYDGAWLDDTLPYHVIHRIASYPDAHGIFKEIIEYAASQDPNLRIDTHPDNKIMRHLIEEYDFKYCGIIYLASGDLRLAYQRLTNG